MLLLVVGLTIYFANRAGSPVRTPADQGIDLAASLDLKYFIVPRGLPESGTPAEEPQILRRRRLALTVMLPLDSEPGTYQFQVVRESHTPLVQAKAEARMEGGVSVALVRLDLSVLPPGNYALGFRRDSQNWTYCPISVVR
jgi:hypothetical protein